MQRRCILTQVKLNKSSLSHEQKNLKNFKQFLPSLDLKRRKLLIEKNKASTEFEKIKRETTMMIENLGNKFPMIADSEININNLLKINTIETKDENIVGVN